MNRYTTHIKPFCDQAQLHLKYSNKKQQNNQIQNKPQLSNIYTPKIKDNQITSCMIKQQIKSQIAQHMESIELSLRGIKKSMEEQKKNRQDLSQQIKLLRIKGNDNYQIQLNQFSLKYPSNELSQSSIIKKLINEQTVMESKLSDSNVEDQILKLRQQLLKQLQFNNNNLKLQIATIQDQLVNIQQKYMAKHHHMVVQSTNILTKYEQTNTEMSTKLKSNSQLSNKVLIELQRLSMNNQINQSKIQNIQQSIKQLNNQLDLKLETNNNIYNVKLTDIEQLFIKKIQKIIIEYNLNFEEIDKNISQYKQITKDILVFIKNLSDKLNIKFNNTIDYNTFKKTIQNINQNFNQNYMMNQQKIKQLNQKQYEVYYQLNEVKNVLKDLKIQYKSYNHLNQDQECYKNKVTSLNDLGINSNSNSDQQNDYEDDNIFKQEETQQPNQNPFRRKTEKQIEESSYQ